MIQVELEEKLLQAVDIINKLMHEEGPEVRLMAMAFTLDFESTESKDYDGSFLTGNNEDLNF